MTIVKKDKDKPFKVKVERQGTSLQLLNSMYNNAKARARKKDIPFNISKEDIIVPKTCPILGIEIKPGIKRAIDNSPSLDRINNSKGYVKGNVRVIFNLANRMKNSASKEHLLKFSTNIPKYMQLTE